MKQYKTLWVFGDSYSTPNYCVDVCDSFWGRVGQMAATSIVNCSWPGNTFPSVWHMLIGMQDQYDWENDLFLIGMPPLERLTVFDDFKDTRYTAEIINPQTWESTKTEISCHTGLAQIKGHEAHSMAIYEDRSWTETQGLSMVFLLTTWLDSVNANYMLLNLGTSFDENNKWGPTEFVLPYAMQHPRAILFNDSYHGINLSANIKPVDFDLYKWVGHHGPEGNQNYFENSLLPRMQKCNLL